MVTNTTSWRQQDSALTFMSMWGLVHAVHYLRHGGSGIDPTGGFILLASAFAVLLFPNRWYLIATLGVIHLLTVLDEQLLVSNHSIIMLIINICLLVGMAVRLPLVALLPTLRIAVLVAYGAAAVSKLNHGFFDVANSCTTEFYGYLQELSYMQFAIDLPAPGWLLSTLPFVIAAAELSIPLLLIVPRTRSVGVLVLVPLHLTMSLNPLAVGGTFTVLVFSLGFLFMSLSTQARFVAIVDRLSFGLVRKPNPSLYAVLMLLFAGVGWAARLRIPLLPTFGDSSQLATNLIGIALGVLLIAAILRSDRSSQPLSWRTPFALVPVLLLVVLNAASPYLGGKTLSVFTMSCTAISRRSWVRAITCSSQDCRCAPRKTTWCVSLRVRTQHFTTLS